MANHSKPQVRQMTRLDYLLAISSIVLAVRNSSKVSDHQVRLIVHQVNENAATRQISTQLSRHYLQ